MRKERERTKMEGGEGGRVERRKGLKKRRREK